MYGYHIGWEWAEGDWAAGSGSDTEDGAGGDLGRAEALRRATCHCS